MSDYDFPSKDAAISALLRAPLLPTGILFALDAIDRSIHFGPLAVAGAAILSVYVLIVMEFFTIILGGLLLAAIWRRVPFQLYILSVLGGFVAVLPAAVLEYNSVGGKYNAWSDGRPTVVDGSYTALGHLEALQTLALVFAFGAVGGAFFWWLCHPKRMTDRVIDDR